MYGTNTAFRLETGDLPEFGFFMPNMGGNLQLGIIKGNESLWLNNAKYIKSIYRAGTRIYEIKDPMFGTGTIHIDVLAMGDAEGMVMKIQTEDIDSGIELVCMYGGASNKRFSRNGDLGVDPPDSFGLKAEACENNQYAIDKNYFQLKYGFDAKGNFRTIDGILPGGTQLKTASPYSTETPLYVWNSSVTAGKPVIVGRIPVETTDLKYVAIKNKDEIDLTYTDLALTFEKAENYRRAITGTVKIITPDPYFNPLGGVLSAAADGIWDGTCWQHGAIGWRMPLNGWRAGYIGDAIGWHDRARIHFDAYAASQVTEVPATIPHPAQDKTLNLARAEKVWGTPMYSNGYICRNPYDNKKMHHYDMNLCYIDELLWHFNWTGDVEYAEKMWPVLERHLAWEKRNFDPDDDGLYDAYACFWASDAVQYNSGAVTLSSAYNYRANKMAAIIAEKIGKNPEPFAKEAEKILNAMNSVLWIERTGRWAEFKDFMGKQMIHPDAAVWTVYHAIDSETNTPFQAYQATRYIDTEIPHIPVTAIGLEDNGYQTIATTNWLPYAWSVNNVAFAEVAHTALAYWQAGRNEEAFHLFKSSVLDGMYLGGSPGNIGQISYYDAARGECYRDFADPVGVYSRALIQGLFGIIPDALNGRMEIRPGFPKEWEFASVSTPDISFDFKQNGLTDKYLIEINSEKNLTLDLLVKARRDRIKSVKINGQDRPWTLEDGIGLPLIKISAETVKKYDIQIEWEGKELEEVNYAGNSTPGENWKLNSVIPITNIYDPQRVIGQLQQSGKTIEGVITGEYGHRTLFVQTEQGQMKWWQPVEIEVKELFSVIYNPEDDKLQFSLVNNSGKQLNGKLVVNRGANEFTEHINIAPESRSEVFTIPSSNVKFGTNTLDFVNNGETVYQTKLINWNLTNPEAQYEMVDIDGVLNAAVNMIFKNEYLTPRSPYTTLQVPVQGIGEWCHPALTADIDDSGIRKAAKQNVLETPFGIPFRTTSDKYADNIAFTTLWDNYPSAITASLSGRASHAYLMMAGSTNHMQSHVTNGIVTIEYEDETTEILNLVNPETWAPIEQDFYLDGISFTSKYPRYYRISFKTAVISRNMEKDMGIKTSEVYGRNIDGGAGIILDIPLDKNKNLRNIKVESVANEVLIGLMGVTLLK